MPAKKLKEYLDSHHIHYETISHSMAFNAQRVAATTHIPGKEMAKTVVVKVDGEMSMAVLPASFKIDLDQLKIATGAHLVALASEMEFKSRFPDCEPGAMPPFGNLYDMRVYVAHSLSEDKMIAFNAGTHIELIRMAYRDFDQLVHPTVLKFSKRPMAHHA